MENVRNREYQYAENDGDNWYELEARKQGL